MTKPKPKRSGFTQRPWLESEREYLSANYFDKSIEALAAILKRGRNDVRAMAAQMGLRKRPSTTGVQWTADKKAELRMMWGPGYTREEIARHFGSTTSSIETIGSKMGLRKSQLRDGNARSNVLRCRRCKINIQYANPCPLDGCAHFAQPLPSEFEQAAKWRPAA